MSRILGSVSARGPRASFGRTGLEALCPTRRHLAQRHTPTLGLGIPPRVFLGQRRFGIGYAGHEGLYEDRYCRASEQSGEEYVLGERRLKRTRSEQLYGCAWTRSVSAQVFTVGIEFLSMRFASKCRTAGNGGPRVQRQACRRGRVFWFLSWNLAFGDRVEVERFSEVWGDVPRLEELTY